MPSPSAATSSRRLRSPRGVAVVVILYALGALGVGFAGYKFLKWNPFKNDSVTTAAQKFQEAEARYNAATQVVRADRQAAQQQTADANATATSDAQRAQATAELTGVKQQLAAEQADKQRHQQLLQESETKLAAAQKTAASAQLSVDRTSRQLQEATSSSDGLGLLLDQLFFWLKLGLALYVVLVYVLPLASHFLPGLHPLANLAHALLNPVMHAEKTGFEALARDASAATDELLELISQRSPETLKEAHARTGAWITEHDGVRALFEKMLKLVQRR